MCDDGNDRDVLHQKPKHLNKRQKQKAFHISNRSSPVTVLE